MLSKTMSAPCSKGLKRAPDNHVLSLPIAVRLLSVYLHHVQNLDIWHPIPDQPESTRSGLCQGSHTKTHCGARALNLSRQLSSSGLVNFSLCGLHQKLRTKRLNARLPPTPPLKQLTPASCVRKQHLCKPVPCSSLRSVKSKICPLGFVHACGCRG